MPPTKRNPGRPPNPETIAKRDKAAAAEQWITATTPMLSVQCTPDTVADVCAHVADGASIEEAAALAGIFHQRVYDWRLKGLRDYELGVSSVYFALAAELQKAEATAAQTWRRGLQGEPKPGLWQKYAWLLERRFPEAWGQRTQIDLDIHEHPPEVPPEPSTTYVSYIQRVRDRVAVALQSSAVDAEHRMVEEGDDQE